MADCSVDDSPNHAQRTRGKYRSGYENFSGQSGFVGAAVAPPPEASGTQRARTRVTRVAMSDLNVTAPPFAPPDSNRVDVPARDNHVAPHPPTPSTRDIEGVRGDDDFDVSVVDPALATTVDAATRAAKENYELVRALCQLLTSTRAQVARLEHRLAQVEAGGAKRKAPPVPSSSSVQGRSEKPPVVVVIAPPPTPTTPASTGGESPTRSPVRRTASKFSWAEDDEVSLFQFSYGQLD
jgi:hypothetical protein